MLVQTVANTIPEVTRQLAAAGIEPARAEAERIVRAVTQLTTEELILHPNVSLTAGHSALIMELTARRAAREPLPYLLGEVEFYSRPFSITRAALVPRPETEILVEAVITRAKAIGARRAADAGTGSGILAVTLALELPGLVVGATDISRPALALAARNVARHGLQRRVLPICGDLLSAVRPPLDFVVANLPYIAHDDFPGLEPEVRDWEPRIALDGGLDGLGLIRRLSGQLVRYLREGGFAALEVGAGQAAGAAKLLVAGGLSGIEMRSDYAGLDRVVIGWRRGS